MNTRNSALFRMITITALLAMFMTLNPPMVAMAQTSSYWQYDDLAPNLGWSGTGQFNAGDISYGEGEVLPQKVIVTGLTANNTTVYGFWITYHYYKPTVCGYDYIADYTTTTRLFSLTPSPDDGGVANGPLSTANGGIGGSMYTIGATAGSVIVGARIYTTSGGLTTARVPVTFTASATTADFYFGLHIGQDSGCGVINSQGAGSWSGGALETSITDEPIAGAIIVKKSTPNKINSGALAQTIFTGVKWNDLDGDGTLDAGEPNLPGWSFQLYRCTVGGAACTSSTLVGTSVTNTAGYYFGSDSAPVLNNYYFICEQLQIGWTPTSPDTTQPIYCSDIIQLTSTFTTATQNFGNWQRYDWGDLPSPYPTLTASNGACHNTFFDYTNDRKPETFGTTPAIWLGTHVDSKTTPDIEFDGQPNAAADGDDISLTPDDEDGITLTSLFEQARYGTMNVSLSSSPPLTSKTSTLVVWFDWNEDGDFSDLDERNIYPFNNWTSNIVDQSLTFSFPNYASLPVNLFFRARLFEGTVSSPAPTGCVVNGEVEDYKEPIGPTAITVSALSADAEGESILVSWRTFNELEMVGFNLYRADSPDGPRSLVFSTPAQFSGKPMGKQYTFSDVDVQTGLLYTYWLEIIQTAGSPTILDPASATLGYNFYLPVIIR